MGGHGDADLFNHASPHPHLLPSRHLRTTPIKDSKLAQRFKDALDQLEVLEVAEDDKEYEVVDL